MNLQEVLFNIADTPAVAGNEGQRAELCAEYLKKYTKNVRVSGANVIAEIGEQKPEQPKILLDAHIDQIGMVCTHITDDGFIKIGNIGGLDRRLLLGQELRIFGKRELIGVISSMPPHLKTDAKKPPEIDEIYVDTGYSSKNRAELEKIVTLGDPVAFNTKCKTLLNGRVTGSSFDNSAGLAAVLLATELLAAENRAFTVLFSAQEEVGGRGAQVAAFELAPDIAVAVDVSFALTADDSEEKCGKLGGGVMIGYSPVLSRSLSDGFVELAKKHEIPYSIEVMPGLTSTNADKFTVTRGGIETGLLSVPLKYMHTPVEVVELADIENTAKLLAKYVMSIDS